MGMSKDEFLANDDFEVRAISIKGGTVHLRTMTHAGADALENEFTKSKKVDDCRGLKAMLVCETLCDDSGVLMFANLDRRASAAALSGKSASTINVLFVEAKKMNGYDADDFEESVGN